MANIEFPEKLQRLLSRDHGLNGWITGFAQRVGEILRGNELTFFPGFTDHGIDHVEAVLRTEVELVPDAVWEKGILSEVDAAVIIGETLLHDLAMHLHEKGFLELVRPGSRWKPLRWFDETHEGHSADRPWSDLWEEYEREARKFSDRALGNIIGLEAVREGWKFTGLPKDKGNWDLNTRLVVGEFVRRHHARLAHEVAMFGFPGLEAGEQEHQFPVLAETREELADLVGLSARSHGMNLRVCLSYLEETHVYADTPRPMGTAVLYPMALLRVADYLQIEGTRAPAVLLQLKDPQSPISVREWKTHKAVLTVTQAKDPAGKKVTVSSKIGLEVFLQLRDLMAGLQREMDHSTAVLEEVYGCCPEKELGELKLRYRRVHSNVNDPKFQKALPYVPERTGFSADPNLLSLLVEPLYGAYPGVGVRELMQNAVDAVRELEVWRSRHSTKRLDLSLNDLEEDADVLIDFIQKEDGTWLLQVQDKGMGMTAETLKTYFLRAGASFRQSVEWGTNFTDGDGNPVVPRAGRFGIGVFALFLLGSSFEVSTRHVSEDHGYFLKATKDSQHIALERRVVQRIGTVVTVEISDDVMKQFGLDGPDELPDEAYFYRGVGENATDWYCLEWPRVIRRVKWATGKVVLLPNAFQERLTPRTAGNGWMEIQPKGFDAIHWCFPSHPFPPLVCNGIRIASLRDGMLDARFKWPENEVLLKRPKVAIWDSDAKLPLTTQRYELSTGELPFEKELARDTTLSFIAHTLVCGPDSRSEALRYGMPGELNRFPLCPRPSRHQQYGSGTVGWHLDRWCASEDSFTPFDPWLYALFGRNVCLMYGFYHAARDPAPLEAFDRAIGDVFDGIDLPVMKWDGGVITSAADWGRRRMAEGRGIDKEEIPAEEVSQAALLTQGEKASSVEIWVCSSDRSEDAESIGRRYYMHDDAVCELVSLGDGKRDGRNRYLIKHGKPPCNVDANAILQSIETNVLRHPERGEWRVVPDKIYLAVVHAELQPTGPKSLISQIWNECLGRQTVPYDRTARRKVIEQGKQHPELRRHIEAWEAMKRAGSPWVKGGQGEEEG